MCKHPPFFEYVGHSITVGFAEIIFAPLRRICALNLKSRNCLTLARPRVAPVRRTSSTRVVSLPETGSRC